MTDAFYHSDIFSQTVFLRMNFLGLVLKKRRDRHKTSNREIQDSVQYCALGYFCLVLSTSTISSSVGFMNAPKHCVGTVFCLHRITEDELFFSEQMLPLSNITSLML